MARGMHSSASSQDTPLKPFSVDASERAQAPEWNLAMPDPGTQREFSSSLTTDTAPELLQGSVDGLPCQFESPSDVFAELFGTKTCRASQAELESMAELLGRIRDAVAASDSLPSFHEGIAEPDVQITFGPLVQDPEGTKYSWIEVFNRDTGDYLCPSVPWLIEGTAESSGSGEVPCQWERFSRGHARLLLELPAAGDGDLMVMPWISPECAEEAIVGLLASMKSGGRSGASCLHAAILLSLIHI